MHDPLQIKISLQQQQQKVNFDFKHSFLALAEPGQGENRAVEMWSGKSQGFPSTWLMAPTTESGEEERCHWIPVN